MLPAFLLLFLGIGFVLEAISWLSVIMTVAVAVCAYKMFRYYLDDPYDIIVSVITVLYPGWLFVALLIASFLQPSGQTTVITENACQSPVSIPVDALEQE